MAAEEEESPLLLSKKPSSTCSNTVDTVIASSYGSSFEGITTKARHRQLLDQECGSPAFPASDHHHHHHHSCTNTDHHTNPDDGSLSTTHNPMSSSEHHQQEINLFSNYTISIPSTRRMALLLSLYLNIAITVAKFIAYVNTFSLSVLAALLDSVLDVVSQVVLNYTEQHSSLQRSSAFYPAGASRLEPIGVLTCAALMGMASFEVIKESIMALLFHSDFEIQPHYSSVYAMIAIVVIKLLLLWLCQVGAYKRPRSTYFQQQSSKTTATIAIAADVDDTSTAAGGGTTTVEASSSKQQQQSNNAVQWADPTMEALAQDHWNDSLSNSVAAVALVLALHDRRLWFLDPIGAILISIYIIYSWYMKGKEQIEHLTGKSAPRDFIGELVELANEFDDRIVVDTVRAYHFGPKFLVEIEIVMHESTLLFESHDLGMDLQYAIEGREEVERCFVHIDYQARPYDEHVVSKVPELREKYVKGASSRTFRSAQSV